MLSFLLATCLPGALAISLSACSDSSNPGGSTDGGAAEADALSNPGVDGGLAGDAAVASDPAAPGSFAAHVVDDVAIAVGSGTATAMICSPSSDGGDTPAVGPFPLVISSPGFQLPRSQYRSMCEHLASWGFVVVSQEYGGTSPNHQALAEDVGDVIDWALVTDGMLGGRVDASKIATVGHSLGGKVSIYAAILDPRIKAVVGWDPVDAKPPIDNGSPSVTPELMGGLTVPLAVIGETLDSTGGFMPCAPAADNYAQYFEHACAAPDVLEVTIADAGHMDWLDDRGSCGFTCSFCQTGATDDAHTREVTRRVTTGFLRQELLGAEGLDGFLTTPAIGANVTTRDTPACD